MLPVILFGLALVFYAIHISIDKTSKHALEILLYYLIFFNIGVMGLLAFYAHTFMPVDIAKQIGWAPGSPFQSEIAMANLAFGVLGVLSLWLRGLFWVATAIGYSIFLLGAFIVHMMQYRSGDTAPLNSGIFVWFGDLFIPLFMLFFLTAYFRQLANK